MDKILVLMSTYNGDKYLREQIESIVHQVGVDVHLLVRDDGSSDNTCNILEEYAGKGLLTWYRGENLKPARSFLYLLEHAPAYEFYAFADQDDVWLNDKLALGIQKVKLNDEQHRFPCLYFGQPKVVDADLKALGKARKSYRLDHLGTLFTVNNAAGCTFVFNHALREAVCASSPGFLVMHDDWVAKVCKAVGGKLVYDGDGRMLYRQHGNNVVGVKRRLSVRIRNRLGLRKKANRKNSKIAMELLEHYGSLMSQSDFEDMQLLSNYWASFRKRLSLAFNKDFKTDSFKVNFRFAVFALLGLF